MNATDWLSRRGLRTRLECHPELRVLDDTGTADVVVVATRFGTPSAVALLRRGCPTVDQDTPTVLVTSQVDNLRLLVEQQVVEVLPRNSATSEDLFTAVAAASERAEVSPACLQTRLADRAATHFGQQGQVEANALNDREQAVLRLLAEGWDTNRIAEQLCYSERTVKNVLYGMTSRLSLRNRAHLVAYAIRTGMI
ncbi:MULTISPECIES: response regulator transcription factor [unclassified Crossiella]|uniref:response regulator transcription factor n=1 Tax=unclassified Crossiella TaxID=2620835 RepID=UPI001FFE63DF|nr:MULTISPECIES: response regulator transcription factor [unclassified Crossiella]MCK2244237.1 response regulator transcription factor [Crossiella sp. S99.2]MCK2258041.1 response regulator transcription factor [Crossiella sp. S99.1]